MTLDFAAGALQGLELCLAPMPLSQLVLREGKAELGRLRRIYAFAGWQQTGLLEVLSGTVRIYSTACAYSCR